MKDIKINHFDLAEKRNTAYIYRVERIEDDTVPKRPAAVLYGKYGIMEDQEKGWLEENIIWLGDFTGELPVEIAEEVMEGA